MQVTNVRIRKINPGGKVKAVVSVTFDDELVVHDIKVVELPKGLIIAMPSQKFEDQYRDTVHPINSKTREKIQTAILEALKAYENGTTE